MVSVLALNRLELREMINQEMIENPVLEEQSEEPTATDNYSDENFIRTRRRKFRRSRSRTRLMNSTSNFFNQYLDTGGDGGQSQEREVTERPSFEKFLSSPRTDRTPDVAAQRDDLFGHPCENLWKALSATWMRMGI